MSPSANFFAAAAAANRQPVILLAVESINAIRRVSTLQTDWTGAKSSSNLNALAPDDLGSVLLVTDGDEPYSGTYAAPTVEPGLSALSTETDVTAATAAVSDRTVSITSSGVCNGYVLNVQYQNARTFTVWLQVSDDAGETWSDIGSQQLAATLADQNFSITGTVTRGTAYLTRLRISYVDNFVVPDGEANYIQIWYNALDYQYSTLYVSSGSLRTISLDLGVIPTIDSTFTADDIVPSGSSLTYTVRGSNDNATWTDLGTVTDGTALDPYRYYDVLCEFASTDGMATPILREVGVVGGDSQFDYFSTHKDQPVKGALPYIKENGISSLTTKIDLMKPSTIGEISVKLFWREKTGDMLATGYLKNKNVICKLGFVGLAESDYEPYFTGTWHDYSADSRTSEISVKTRDVWKKFKRSVPEETTDADGNKTTQPLTLSGNIIQVILDIVDLVNAPDRYIDRATFETLRDTVYTGSDWDVSRTLSSAEGAEDLVNELAVAAGLFVFVGGDGKLTAVAYDAAAAATPDSALTLDANRIDFEAIDGGQAELKTRHRVHYQLIPGKDGGSAEDYLKQYININATAETNWQEVQELEWMDRWGLSTNAVQQLAQRLDLWFANPKFKVKAKKIPPRFMPVTVGTVVPVDNLEVPATAANWQAGTRYTSQKAFLVTSKTIDPRDMTLSFELLEIGPTDYSLNTLPSYPAYTLFPPVTGLTLTERIEKKPGGGVDLFVDVNFTTPADFRYNGADVWYRTAAVWIWAGPVSYGGPSELRTFPLPVVAGATYDIAVVTTNAAGLKADIADSPQASVTVAAAVVPAAVTGLTQRTIDNNVLLYWVAAVAGTFPVDYYRIIKGTDFGAAVEVGRVPGTFASLFETAAGQFKYWVVPVDTAGQDGPETGIYATVTAPPDFELKDQTTLDWSGTITNGLVENNELVVPVDTSETIEEHFDNNSWSTPQDQIDAGLPVFIQPGANTAAYEQTIDYGAAIDAARIVMDVTRTTVIGTVTVTPTISVKLNSGDAWTDYASAYEVYATSFRYVKYGLAFATADNGIMRVSNITTKIDVKKKTWEAKVACVSSDSGGTSVDITGLFSDVTAITVTPWGTSSIVAVVDFTDAPNPTTFKVLLFNSTTGARVTATATVIVRGV